MCFDLESFVGIVVDAVVRNYLVDFVLFKTYDCRPKGGHSFETDVHGENRIIRK